jgi:large subunit ribosomal protein L32
MGLPGHRRTSSHKRRRASHFALKKLTLVSCPKCKQPNLPHTVCANCGTYAGRQVLAVKTSLDKRAVAKKKHDHGHEGHDHADHA